jgi:hypothetical protein
MLSRLRQRHVQHFGQLASQGGVTGVERAVAVARDDAVPSGGFYIGIVGAAGRDIGEGGHGRLQDRPRGRSDNDLAELAHGEAVIGAERAVGKAADYSVEEACFDVEVMPVCRLDIGKSGLGWGVKGPGLTKDHHFHELSAGGTIIGAESIVGVAGDDAVANQPVDGLIEVVAGVYV